MSASRRRAAVLCVIALVASSLTAVASPTQALERSTPAEVRAAAGSGPFGEGAEPDGHDLYEACVQSVGGVPEAGDRACRTFLSTIWNMAAFCRRAGLAEDTCSRIDGRVVSEERMQTYEASWVHRAHTLQRDLDRDIPLKQALVPATHNSFNSFAYDPTFSGTDANQVVSMRDQLRLDMRSLELDVHWAPSAEGDPGHGMHAPILCHGAPVGQHPAMVHVGCTTERHFREGLIEIREWLEEDGNEDAFLLLYLENNLRDHQPAHEAAAETIAEEMGDLVIETDEPCAPMPTDQSRSDLVETSGPRVLLVGNCDPDIAGAWGRWVHERAIPQGVWWESGGSRGTVYPEDCDEARVEPDYDTTFVRYFEGETWLQVMTGTGGDTTEEETRRMVRCGVNLFGFDHLHPDDPRLEALIWSWAPDEPGIDDGCAFQGGDGRFHADANCEEPRPVACVDDDGNWSIGDEAPWSEGAGACGDARFAVPATGYENLLLTDMKDDVDEVWLNYRGTGGTWEPNAVS